MHLNPNSPCRIPSSLTCKPVAFWFQTQGRWEEDKTDDASGEPQNPHSPRPGRWRDFVHRPAAVPPAGHVEPARAPPGYAFMSLSPPVPSEPLCPAGSWGLPKHPGPDISGCGEGQSKDNSHRSPGRGVLLANSGNRDAHPRAEESRGPRGLSTPASLQKHKPPQTGATAATRPPSPLRLPEPSAGSTNGAR